MTTPTQAQIEAAALALYYNAGAPTEILAKAALTAAAQVEEQELQPLVDAITLQEVYREKADTIEAATIERCKQVILAMDEMQTVADYAAALDKLKD